MHLLVVEDEGSIAEPLVEGLRAEGFEVTRVATGREALDAPLVDLVLLDVRLPDLDGFTVCRELRARSDVPIIMVTAYSERGRVIDAINAGVDEFLVKPIRAVDVANRVNAVVERRRPFIQTTSYFGPDRRRRDDPRHRGPWRRASDPGTVDI